MGAWISSLVSVFIVSLISLIGILTLTIKIERLQKLLLFFVSFSAGALLGGAFLHLIPEAIEECGCTLSVSLTVLCGIIFFFILEKIVHWRHCHIPTSKKHPHPLAFMNLIGDGLHNLIDGMLIAAAYLINFNVGLATTIAVVIHEIPQEIGDFGVLLHAGMSRKKALFYNFMTALTAVLGAVVTLLIGSSAQEYLILLLPLTAGGFIYIAGTDLIPELHKESCTTRMSLMQLVSILAGIAIMLGLKMMG